MLRAFDARNVANELWNSEQLTIRDRLGKFAKFCAPDYSERKSLHSHLFDKVVVYGVIHEGKLREPKILQAQ